MPYISFLFLSPTSDASRMKVMMSTAFLSETVRTMYSGREFVICFPTGNTDRSYPPDSNLHRSPRDLRSLKTVYLMSKPSTCLAA